MGAFLYLFSTILFAQNLSQGCLIQLLKNISPPGTHKGVVVASPSKSNPDYFKHWVRDGALVQREIVQSYIEAHSLEEKDNFFKILNDYREFSIKNQRTSNLSNGLGEPFFLVDGSATKQEWGRPQNDGPALRAVTFIDWAEALLLEGKENWVKENLYAKNDSLIKNDLEYVSRHWKESCFDLWEEINGKHFFTLISQWDAMERGAAFAAKMSDPGAQAWYLKQTEQIKKFLEKYWDSTNKVFWPTWDRVGGIAYKNSGIDVGNLIAILMTKGRFISYSDDRLLQYVRKIESSFESMYSINKGASVPMIGRYPEDQYDGYETGRVGNPWFITTNAVGEFYFRLASQLETNKEILITAMNREFFESLLKEDRAILEGGVFTKESRSFSKVVEALKARGVAYLNRVLSFQGPNGSMAEQIDRNSGANVGATNLTWSYASFLSFLRAMK